MSNGNKNTLFVEANVINMSAKFQLHPLMASEEIVFEYFFREFNLSVAMATNQIHMFGKRLLKEHLCKICNEISIKAYFHFYNYKSMETLALIATKAHEQLQ